MHKGNSISASRMKWFAWLCVLMLLLSVLPLYAISVYSHPHYDDYGFSANVRHTWVDNGNVLSVLKTAAQSSSIVRQTWQGTYLGTFLSNIQPGVFSENLYFLTTFILLTAFLLGFGYLWFTALRIWFRAGLHETLVITCLALFLMIQLLPQINEGFYWFNGGIGNTFVYSLIAVSLALMLRLWVAQKAGARGLSAGLLLLMIALGGGSYGGGLFLICISALITIYALWTKHRFRFVYAGLLIVLTGCFVYSMMAPGNDHRALIMGTRISAPVSVLKSVYYGLSLMGSYFTLPVISVMLFLLPIFWKLVQNSDVKFQHPLIILGLGLGLFCVQLVPPMFSGVFIGGGRIQNTYYFSFIVMVLLYELYLLGFIAKRQKIPFVFTASLQRGIAVLSAVLFAFGMFGFYRPTDGSFSVKNLTGVEAAVSMLRGEAQQYDAAMDMRERMLNDEQMPDVVLTPLYSTPKSFMPDSLTAENAAGIADSLKGYYKKQSVSIQ